MSSCLIVTLCNKRAGWLAPPQHPSAPALNNQPAPGTCVLPMFFRQQSGKNSANPHKSMKSLWFPRCSPACPASREQPSVSAPSHNGSADQWSRRRPTAPRAAQIPEIGNPQPAANGVNSGKPQPHRNGANGEKPAPPCGQANGRKPHPQLNKANGEKPVPAPNGGKPGTPSRQVNGGKRAPARRQINGGKPHPHRNEANGEIPESARAPRGGFRGVAPRGSTPRISGKLAQRACEQHELSRGRGGI